MCFLSDISLNKIFWHVGHSCCLEYFDKYLLYHACFLSDILHLGTLQPYCNIKKKIDLIIIIYNSI